MDLLVEFDPQGKRPFGMTAYNITVSTKVGAPRYEAEYLYSIWLKSPNSRRAKSLVEMLSEKIRRRLQLPYLKTTTGAYGS